MTSVIGRFERPEDLIAAVRAAREAGYRRMDAYAPFPVPGLEEALGYHERWIPLVALVAAIGAGIGTFFMQWYSAVIAYPFVVGGKPLNSWPAFVLPTTAFCILAAVLGAFLAMLAANRLPQPYHPAFNWPAFDRASEDGFFLMLEGEPSGSAREFMRARAAETQELFE